jgi:hypothetical protein
VDQLSHETGSRHGCWGRTQQYMLSSQLIVVQLCLRVPWGHIRVATVCSLHVARTQVCAGMVLHWACSAPEVS